MAIFHKVRYNAQKRKQRDTNTVRYNAQDIWIYMRKNNVNEAPTVGGKIRELRKLNKWSLDATSRQTGVSKAMLGQIERGESSPTLATLWKVATGFHVSLSSLIQTTSAATSEYVLRKNERENKVLSQGMHAQVLFPFDSNLGFEVFAIHLDAGAERVAEPHNDGVFEHITVVSGSIELLINEEWQSFCCGDSVRFQANAEHGYRNPSSNPATIHVIISY